MDTQTQPTHGTTVLVREMLNPYSNNRRPGRVIERREFPVGQEQYAADWALNHDLDYWVDINHH